MNALDATAANFANASSTKRTGKRRRLNAISASSLFSPRRCSIQFPIAANRARRNERRHAVSFFPPVSRHPADQGIQREAGGQRRGAMS